MLKRTKLLIISTQLALLPLVFSTAQGQKAEQVLVPGQTAKSQSAEAVVVEGMPALKFASLTGAETLIYYKKYENEDAFAIPVFHLHFAGECQGWLYVTPTKVTYKSDDNPEDSFDFPKSEIKELKIDNNKYLRQIQVKSEKNTKKLAVRFTPFLRYGGQEKVLEFCEIILSNFDSAVKLFQQITDTQAAEREQATARAKAREAAWAEYSRKVEQALREGEPQIKSLSAEIKGRVRNGLRALRKMAAATEVGVTLQEYSSRLIDTKAEVDEVIALLPESILKSEINNSLEAYIDTGHAWNEMIKYDFLIPEHSRAQLLMEKYPLKPTPNLAGRMTLSRDYVLNTLWRIAREHLNNAAKLIEE